MGNKILYFAYGSNLNKRQMEIRCPDSKPLCRYTGSNYRLTFRYHANIEKCVPGSKESVPGAIYEISKRDERMLDRYEGVDHHGVGGYYRKAYFESSHGLVLVYIMVESTRGKINRPDETYYNVCVEGCEDWGLGDAHMIEAAKQSGVNPEYDGKGWWNLKELVAY